MKEENGKTKKCTNEGTNEQKNASKKERIKKIFLGIAQDNVL